MMQTGQKRLLSWVGVLACTVFGAPSYAAGGEQSGSVLKELRPDYYTVVPGDTLWDIANTFLHDPWRWNEVWAANPQIGNPHKIYPGDIVRVVSVGGQMRITVSREVSSEPSRRTIKLSPRVRVVEHDIEKWEIPIDSIRSFLASHTVVGDQEVWKRAPYVLSNSEGRVLSSTGDTLYARGNFSRAESVYGVFRPGTEYIDPHTGEPLGQLAHSVGTLRVSAIDNNIATLEVSSIARGVRAGDRLLPLPSPLTSFSPVERQYPAVKGEIIDVLDGVKRAGHGGSVVLNLGARNGVHEGDVLTIIHNAAVKDPVTGQSVELPTNRVGRVMIYRTYTRVSLAVVLQAEVPVAVGDRLRSS